MNKKGNFLGILIVIVFIVFMIALICGAVMLILGDVSETALFLGVIGLVGFAAIFIGFIILGRRHPRIDDRTQSDKFHEEYVALVDKADAQPAAFARKLNRLCYLGNIYVLLLLSLIVLSLVGIVMVGVFAEVNMGGFGIFGAALIGTAYVVIKSLYVKNELPDTPKVSRNEYPLLFELIDEASVGTSSKRMDQVYLSPDATCAVTRVPMGFKNYNIMCIGIYVLELLNKEELKSVFFHEFAHISNKDTKTGQKASKNLMRWQNIITALDRKGFIANTLLGGFANYYTTKLNMYLAAISKQREFLADKTATKYTSPEVFAAAQAKLEIMNLFLLSPNEPGDFDIRSYEMPPDNYFHLLFSEFYKKYDKNKSDWLLQIKKRMSTKYDSHPTFTDRLKAIGIDEFSGELSFEKDNSDYQKEIAGIIEKMNGIWVSDMEDEWDNVTEDYVKSRKVIDVFAPTDDVEKLLEYGMALETIGENDGALTVYDQLLDSNPDNVGALFRKGQILLSRNNDDGLELIKKTVDLDNDFTENGLMLIGNYLVANGMEEKRDELKEWALEKENTYVKKQDEIDNLHVADRFLPCDLSDEIVDKVRNVLSGFKDIKNAYLVKKELKHTVADYYVLAIMQNPLLSFKKRQANFEPITEKINELGFACFLLDLNTNLPFTKPITLVKNAEIFKGVVNGNK
jgi:Zn-dependent protease with chaperone function